MRSLSGAGVFREIERLLDPGTVAGLSESQLLDRFVDRRDPVAFEAIVSRHGPMVLSVCRVALTDANDVDDAFQATFAILIEKARRLRRPERLGPWLHGVAYRVAHRARTRRRERSIPEDLAGRSTEDRLEKREQLAALHDEIQRLPDKYRLPVVLCCLEEQSGEEAARRLGWPIGTVHGRLSRARNILRDRLSRHKNFAPMSLPMGFQLLRVGQGAVPHDLSRGTVGLLSKTVPPGLQSLVAGVLSAMLFEKLKTLGFAGAAALSVVGTVSFLAAFQPPSASVVAQAAAAPGEQAAAKSSAPQDATQKHDYNATSRPRTERVKGDPVAQEQGEDNQAGRLSAELELLELECTIYRDAIKRTKGFIVGVDVEGLESDLSNPNSNPSTKNSAEASLSNVRSSIAHLETLKKQYLNTRAEIAALKAKFARNAGSGTSPGKGETGRAGSPSGPEDQVARVAGLRSELELLEMMSDQYRDSIRRSMSSLDASDEEQGFDESGLAKRERDAKAESREVNRHRTQDRLEGRKKRYLDARAQIARLKSHIAHESEPGKSPNDDETRDSGSEISRRLDRLEKKIDEISDHLSRSRGR